MLFYIFFLLLHRELRRVPFYVLLGPILCIMTYNDNIRYLFKYNNKDKLVFTLTGVTVLPNNNIKIR